MRVRSAACPIEFFRQMVELAQVCDTETALHLAFQQFSFICDVLK